MKRQAQFMADPSIRSELPLDQRISFRLQRIGSLLTTQAVNLLKQNCGLTLNQWRLLSFLSEREGGAAHELAKLGQLDKGTMSRAAAQLQNRGLVVAEISSADRRSTVLRLTPDGLELFKEIAPLMTQRQLELTAALSEVETARLFQSLDKLETAIFESKLET